MKTYRVQLDARPVAGWTSWLLDPVVDACRFERPSPLELRPTGQFLGWCLAPSGAGDGRVSISSRAVFWSPTDLIMVYVHECAHALLQQLEQEDNSHGPVFYCVNLALLLRCDQAKLTPRPLAPKMSLYDLSDPPQIFEDEPDPGVGRSIAWAINAAHTLAASSETAEQMTVSAEKLFAAFLASAVVEPALVVQVAALRSTIFLQNVVVSVLGAVLMTVMSATLVWRLA